MPLIRTAGVLLAGLLAAGLLAGCAEPGEPGGAPPSSVPAPAPSTPAPTSTPVPMPTPPVRDVGGGRAVRARLAVHRGAAPVGALIGPAWRLRASSAGSPSVRIAWYDAPSAACGAATDVWVAESADAVVIDLAGHGVGPTILCAAIVVPRTMSVPLSVPLGHRRLLEHPATGRRRAAAGSSAPLGSASPSPATTPAAG
jgi:hypothetical protein